MVSSILCVTFPLSARYSNNTSVSSHVASVGAVIDLGFNGYRDLILPMAENDQLVRQAIVAVSDQHLASQSGRRLMEQTVYGDLLRHLISRSRRFHPWQDEPTLTALLLLHIREMIGGSGDFHLLYGSLRTIVNSSGFDLVDARFPIGRFVQIQVWR